MRETGVPPAMIEKIIMRFLFQVGMETSRKIAQCIGKNLAKIRLERGLTKGDFAKELGISEPVYLAIEAGKNNLTIQTIGGIAEHLRVSAVGLMLEPERIY